MVGLGDYLVSFWGRLGRRSVTPLKINMEHNHHGGLVQIMTSFLFMGDGCRFQPLNLPGCNFQGWLSVPTIPQLP